LDEIAQNSFFLGRKSELIKGWDNTIVIDNDGRRKITQFPTIADGIESYKKGSVYDIGPGIKDYRNDKGYTYILGDATNAYDKNKVKRFTREIVYLKPDKFIILDKVTTKKAGFKKSWLIHPGAPPQLIKESLLLIKNNSSALWIKRLLPEDLEIDQTVSKDLIKVTATNEKKTSIFLFVLQVTKSSLNKNSSKLVVDQAEYFLEGDTICVLFDKQKILFNMGEEQGFLISKVVKDTKINIKFNMMN
jgi:hypothetical protein